MKKLTRKALVGVVGMLLFTVGTQAAPTYVGSWYVGDGPDWHTNPVVLSAQETAAMLFGGAPTDYAISTVDNDPSHINFRAHVDGWGDFRFMDLFDVAQDYKLDLGAPGYDDPEQEGASYSAFVLDHSCDNRFAHPEQPCLENQVGLNFAFRVSAVPEPATFFLLGAGLVGLGAVRRKRS